MNQSQIDSLLRIFKNTDERMDTLSGSISDINKFQLYNFERLTNEIIELKKEIEVLKNEKCCCESV